MKALRAAAVVAAFGLIVASAVAWAAPRPGVKGGGFIKAGKTKATLTISGFDNGFAGDTGHANFVRHTKGQQANAVHVMLDCVNVIENTAISAGLGSDGQAYLLVVQDNGEGRSATDAFAVVPMLGAHAWCFSGIVPSDVRAGRITGGNYQVFSGSAL